MNRKSLNDLLEDAQNLTYENDGELVLSREGIKAVVKDWLKDVGLPDYFIKGDNVTEKIRKLLITLVNEP